MVCKYQNYQSTCFRELRAWLGCFLCWIRVGMRFFRVHVSILKFLLPYNLNRCVMQTTCIQNDSQPCKVEAGGKQGERCAQQDQSCKQLNKRMMNGQEVAKAFQRFIRIEKMYCIIMVVQIFITVIYVHFAHIAYELDYVGQTTKSNLLLCALNTSTVPAMLLGVLSFLAYNDVKASEMKELDSYTYDKLVFHFAVMLIQPYRMLQDVKMNNYDLYNLANIDFKVNYALVIVSLLKFCLLIPSFLNMHKFKHPRSSRLCNIYGISNSNLYTIKLCFKQSPITLILCTFLLSFMIFSFAYRVSERGPTGSAYDFEFYSNALWLVVVTMSTVGFGDFVPHTYLGRSVGLLCTFCGVLTVSIMVVVVINTFQLDQNENKALRILKKLEQKKEIKKIAGSYIRLSMWRTWQNYKKRSMDRYCQIQQEGREQKAIRNLLKQKIRLSKFSDANSIDLGSEMNGQFEKIQHGIQNLEENTDQIINYLSNKYFINLNDFKEEAKTSYGFNFGLY